MQVDIRVLILVTLAALGGLVLARRFGRGRGSAFNLGLAVVGVLGLGGGLSALTGLGDPADAVVPEEGRPVEARTEGHVTSRSCRPCHPSEYATWDASYHSTMTQLATPDVVRGDFGDVTVAAEGRSYRMQRRGDQFFVNDERVLMTTGSHHMQAYWISEHSGRQVNLVQLFYLFEDRRWIPRRDAFLQPPGVPPRVDQWNDNCIQCHATQGRPRLAQDTDTTVAEFGISCEACHGPGEAHVAANRSPLSRYSRYLADEPDSSVTNPARLSARLSSHVCARCHGISVFTTDRQADDYFNGDGDPYRPGADLNATGHVVLGPDDPLGPTSNVAELQDYTRDTMFWPDGPSRGSGREFNAMALSKCFGTGEGPRDVSCISCHALHKKAGDPRPLAAWTDDQLGAGMRDDQACLQCHAQDLQADLTRHTRHTAESSGSRCYNCHMPHTTYGLLKAIRSHYISSPDVATDLETGRPNACNLCHLDRPLGWTADHLQEWYGTPPPELVPEQRQIAASVQWLLAGEARQRALVAWHAGWRPAQATSGDDWIAPFLAPLLSDPYASVRVVALRSLRTLPGFTEFDFDYSGAPAHLADASRRAWQDWRRTGTARRDAALLIGARGLDGEALGRLLSRRDDRPVGVVE